jgi:hypothetical protein
MAAGVSIDDSDDGVHSEASSKRLVVLPHHLPRPVYVPPPPPDCIEPLFETVNGNIIGKFNNESQRADQMYDHF